MPPPFHPENTAPRPLSRTRRRWRRAGAAAASIAVLFVAWAASASAAGPLYIVPSHPPSASEAVGFTNDLNDRARRLPPSLDPPVAESPAQIEARIEDLERGVVVEREPKPRTAQPMDRQADVDVKAFVAREPGDQPPLNAAFVAAGTLAVLGLVLGARRHSGAPRGS